MKFIYTLLILFLTSIFLSAQPVTTSVIKAPAQLLCNDVPVIKNRVVFGAIPPNSDDKPVVVYVHGWFDNGFSWFMSNNKWYEKSYNEGYRTAYFFHSFSDAFEDNGKVIAEMIRKTCLHYNTKNVVAICHSKGGLDLEYALYNENVWDSIAGVITLSAPYYGAPLIDVIKNPIIRLITENIPFIGPIFKGKGTYQMQPAYMVGVIRPMMDNNQYNKPEKFHCFGGTGFEHKTVFPNAIPDDILKIIFPNYNPLCISIPGFGVFAGDLMSAGMLVTGNITKLLSVPIYNNPQRNTSINDGLVPYYSAIRPGSVSISPSVNSPQSYLNHIDVLFSWYAWNIVKLEIEYFKNNPVYRISKPNTNNQNIEQTEIFKPISNLQLIQTQKLEIDNIATAKLYVVGNYKNQSVSVFDENNQLVKTIYLNYNVESLYSIFHEIDLTTLPVNKKYTLQSLKPITGIFQDGNNATIQLNIVANKTYYADEALGFEIILNDWNDNAETSVVKGTMSRNMNENGDVVYDKSIPISFVYDEAKHKFICNDKLALESGVYNLSVYADGNNIKRFTTSSILVKQEKKSIIEDINFLSVYPNPTNDVVNINFIATEIANYSVEIFDVIGKKLIEKNLGNINVGSQQIQVSTKDNNLSKGTYLISLSINGERKSSKVIVVN